MADLTGYLLAKHYKISQRLGAGGMGEVWLAMDTQLGREVAIKFILPHFAQHPGAREAFMAEARLVAQLDHPYIVKVYDVGLDRINNQMAIYLVLQYAANGTLLDRLKEGTLSLSEANRIMQQICQALDYAHQRPIIHLDMKPANILFDSHDNVLVNDFGLARVLEKHTHVSLSHAAGTPAYMPPEQYFAGKAGPFSDVFALGVMFYQMVTGALPRREFDEQPEIYFDGPLPALIQTVVTQATLMRAKQRYPSVNVFARELERAVNMGMSKPESLVANLSISEQIIEANVIKPELLLTIPSLKITFDWVMIPTGEFTMGSNERNDEIPIHKVYLSEYKISRFPVTNEQWGVFLQDSGYQWAGRSQLWKDGLPHGQEKHPVVYVTWYDCLAFCKWARVRLPTEAQWEKAARSLDERIYPWGNQKPTANLCNFNRNIGGTTPVGHYPKGESPFGCLDMGGNVWEWCSSDYKTYPYQVGDGRESITTNNPKIMRGGSWVSEAYFTRAAARSKLDPTQSNLSVGFRCAL